MSDGMTRVPPRIEAMVNRMLDEVTDCVGESNAQNQFALLLTTLGSWIEQQADPGEWIQRAIDTLGKHRSVNDKRN